MHYGIREACQASDMPISKECIALITELTLRQAEMMANDLECFSQHAKRSVPVLSGQITSTTTAVVTVMLFLIIFSVLFEFRYTSNSGLSYFLVSCKCN